MRSSCPGAKGPAKQIRRHRSIRRRVQGLHKTVQMPMRMQALCSWARRLPAGCFNTATLFVSVESRVTRLVRCQHCQPLGPCQRCKASPGVTGRWAMKVRIQHCLRSLHCHRHRRWQERAAVGDQVLENRMMARMLRAWQAQRTGSLITVSLWTHKTDLEGHGNPFKDEQGSDL